MQALMDLLQGWASDESVLPQLIVWLSAASAFVLVIGGSVIFFGLTDPLRGRISGLTRDDKQAESNDWIRRAALSLGPIGAFVLPQNELERHKVMVQLHRAGFRSTTALQVFYFVKLLLMVALPLLVLVGSRWMTTLDAQKTLLYTFAAASLGLLTPNYLLHRMTNRRKRALSNGFPDALDLLVVCVESGLGLAAAIQRVASELEVSHPELAEEMALVNAEIRVGVPRDRALKNFSDRTGLDDIRGLVGLLVQTMRFGTGIADALRIYSEEFRDKRTQKAEELAAKMGTKLIFPLVLCMFPALFVVAIGPAALRLIEAFRIAGAN